MHLRLRTSSALEPMRSYKEEDPPAYKEKSNDIVDDVSSDAVSFLDQI